MSEKQVIHTTVTLSPEKLTSEFETNIINKVKSSYGDKCGLHGFIAKDSIKILRRTVGKIAGNHLGGHLSFEVYFEADVINPRRGDIVEGVVTNMNQSGLLAEKYPLRIYVPREIPADKTRFNDVEIGQTLTFKVVYSDPLDADNVIEITADFTPSDMIGGEDDEVIDTHQPSISATDLEADILLEEDPAPAEDSTTTTMKLIISDLPDIYSDTEEGDNDEIEM